LKAENEGSTVYGKISIQCVLCGLVLSFCVCGGKISESPTKLCLSRNSVISVKNLIQLDELVSAVQICKLTDFGGMGG